MVMSDAQFFKALAKSNGAVDRVASWLARVGYVVSIRPTVLRPHFDDRMQYNDGGDININLRIQVKERDLNFTSAADYPYDTIFVDEVRNVDRLFLHVHCYIIVNKAWTHCAIIEKHTNKYWTKIEKHSTNTNDKRSFYQCPKKYAKFYPMENGDKEGEDQCRT